MEESKCMDSTLLKPNQVLIRVYLVSIYKKYISIVLYRDSKTQSHLDIVFTVQKEFDYVLMRKIDKKARYRYTGSEH